MTRTLMQLSTLILTCSLQVTSAQAAPAGWYLFQSKSTGETVCLQTAPSKSWTAIRGPYRDAGCRIAKKR